MLIQNNNVEFVGGLGKGYFSSMGSWLAMPGGSCGIFKKIFP